MELVRPLTWAEALSARAERTDLLPIAGGTDVMVDINFGRRRPSGLLDLTRLAEIAAWSIDDDVLRIGAGVTYTQVQSDLAGLVPGLAMTCFFFHPLARLAVVQEEARIDEVVEVDPEREVSLAHLQA